MIRDTKEMQNGTDKLPEHNDFGIDTRESALIDSVGNTFNKEAPTKSTRLTNPETNLAIICTQTVR